MTRLAAALILAIIAILFWRWLTTAGDPEGMNETPVERGVRYWQAAA